MYKGIDIERRFRSPASLFFLHEETFWCKLAIVCNSQKRMRKGVRTVPCLILLLVCSTNGSIETPVIAQLTHMLLFLPLRTGHRNCRFTPKFVPILEQNCCCDILWEYLRPESPFVRADNPSHLHGWFIYTYNVSLGHSYRSTGSPSPLLHYEQYK